VCGGSSIFGVGRLIDRPSWRPSRAEERTFSKIRRLGRRSTCQEALKVNLQGQGWRGWLFSGNDWNSDVISNDNVAENRLPEPVSLAMVGKKVFLERKVVWKTYLPCESFFAVG
jgi:Na+-transporting NADH:ubiquinone oxidoreductase subunit NqrF